MINQYIQCPLLLAGSLFIPERIMQTFLNFLEENGYASTTINQYLAVVIHFAHWQRLKGDSNFRISSSYKADFIALHLPSCQCPASFPRSKRSIAAALSHLVRLECQDQDTSPDATGHNALVFEYDCHLDKEAGLSSATRNTRCRYAMEFLQWLAEKPSNNLKSLSFEQLSSFICHRATQVSPATTASISSSLSSFLRFLSVQGLCPPDSGVYVPHPKLLHNLPTNKSLSVEELNRLLAAIDRSYPVGKRDYAITRCLSDLGLRTCEVAGLTLDDIDWRNKVISLHSPKVRRRHKLPIPDTLMEALIGYITANRPKTETRRIFVYHRAPWGKPVNVSTIRGVVRRAFRKAGFPSSQSQVHRLRHTMATRLISSGTALKSIADVLGHQCIDTTIKYTYVSKEALQNITLPWPGRTI